MSFIREEKNGNAIFHMKGAMTVYEAVSIRDAFIEGLEAFNGVILDLKKVTKLDIPGIQLIVSAKKTAEKRKKAFTVSGFSDSVAETVFRTGFEQYAIFEKDNQI
ncbi:STAS domain-containing protein [Desulfococcaceae bacterium HSG9]|nr:STAS domain-containing protein [Desulfococcaceae bacterium HSG9]